MHRTDTQAARAAPSHGRQYLSFRLAGMEYGIDLEKVQELRPLRALERFATAGEIVPGVALSRGVIMPIVDMRVAFGASAAAARTDVIILQLASGRMGMVVDGVTDIVLLSGDAILPIPGAVAGAGYLIGLGQVDGRRLILLDIDRLMSIRKDSDVKRAALPVVRAGPATALPVPPDPS